MSTSLSERKSFEISKWEVWQAYQRVKANKGAPGVDGVTIVDFETNLQDNLYRIWNRMSSGSYFPPPVRAVPIPKPGGGVRTLGVPTVADRVAQTVVAARLEERVEPMFHPDSYGYRPGRSALDAVAVTRQRCWSKDWAGKTTMLNCLASAIPARERVVTCEEVFELLPTRREVTRRVVPGESPSLLEAPRFADSGTSPGGSSE